MIWLTLPAPDLMAHEGACRSAHLGCEGALRQLLEKAAVAAYLLDRLCLTHNGHLLRDFGATQDTQRS